MKKAGGAGGAGGGAGAGGAAAGALAALKLAIKLLRVAFKVARRSISLLASIGLPFLVALTIIALIIIGGSSAAVLGDKLAQLVGISKKDLAFLKDVDEETLKEIRKEVGDDIYAAFDCSNYPPSQRRPGVNCIDGLLASLEAKNQGPVPKRAEYLVPIWQAAGERYQVPWQLIAAVNAARTNFGWIDCKSKKRGDGFYRIHREALERYGTNAGSTPLKGNGPGCYQVPKSVVNQGTSAVKVADPDQDKAGKQGKGKRKGGKGNKARSGGGKRQPGTIWVQAYEPLNKLSNERKPDAKITNVYDPVDASFTTARMLAANGAFKAKDWNYAGSPHNDCTTAVADGRIWYLPKTGIAGFGSGARMGYNKKLSIPRWAVLLAAKYRSNKGKYKPRRADTAEDKRLGYHPMPKKHLLALLRVAWYAFGVRGEELNRNVAINYQGVFDESGGRPYILQSIYLHDPNYNNPAGGLFGFIPEAFDYWKVDGFNDRFNPLDNILAGVNAQVNAPYPIYDGGGWSPGTSRPNPYRTGGKSEVIDGSTAGGAKGKPVERKPYRGKPQDDRVSKAVAYQQPHSKNSACYVAVVNEWYEAIKKHPPPIGLSEDEVRNRIVELARAELEKGVSETGGDNVPRYKQSGKIAPYNINNFWCAAFASWIYYQAGIKEMTSVPGMRQSGGLTLPAAVVVLYEWGKQNGRFHKDNPKPGDLIIYNVSQHVGIVEKVSPNGQLVSSIEGNYSNAVTRRTSFSGITGFVSPPAVEVGGDGTLQNGPGNTTKVTGGGKIVPIPNSVPHDKDGGYVDARIVDDLVALAKKYDFYVTDGYAGPYPPPNGRWTGYCCHAKNGDHPLGLAVDVVPVKSGSCSAAWGKITALAKWAEPTQNNPKPPFRWVGYDGDAAHGCGHHLHLSWDHSASAPYHSPEWVLIFSDGKGGGDKAGGGGKGSGGVFSSRNRKGRR